MATLTWMFDVELNGRDNGWTDISDYVLAPARWRYGISGSGPNDVVAAAGVLDLVLDNLDGLFSPGRSTALPGFVLKARVRVRRYDASDASTLTRFLGAIRSITPAPGLNGPRTTTVTATDWLDEAAVATTRGLVTQIDKRSDEILALLIGNMAKQPESQTLDVGLSTFPYALDTARDDSANPILQEIQRVVVSEGASRFFQRGDGEVRFIRRFGWLPTTDVLTLTDDMAGLDVSTTMDGVVTRIQATVHPRVVDTTTQVLYRLQHPIRIQPGESYTLLGGYTDPNNRASRVGGTAMVSPVSGVDYLANAADDGSGADLTASLAVTANLGGNGVSVELTDGAATELYVTQFDVRGKGIYDYEQAIAEVEDPTYALSVGDRPVLIDMPYQSDPAVGRTIASYLMTLYGAGTVTAWRLGVTGADELGISTRLATRTHSAVGSVTVAPLTDALQTAIATLDIGDRVRIVESVTGIAKSFHIHSVAMEVGGGAAVATWGLAPADETRYWHLGLTGFDELGSGTRLAFS